MTAPQTRTEIVVPPRLNPFGDRSQLQQWQLITGALDELRSSYAKHHRWLQACTGVAFGADEPSLRLMPSKAAKYRMYEQAGRLVSLCGWPRDTVRCQSMDDIAVLIAGVEKITRSLLS